MNLNRAAFILGGLTAPVVMWFHYLRYPRSTT